MYIPYYTHYEDWLLVVYCLGIESVLPLPCEAVGLCGWGICPPSPLWGCRPLWLRNLSSLSPVRLSASVVGNLSSLSPVRLSASVVEELQFAKRFEFSLPRKLYILTFFVNIVLSKKQSLILPIFGVQTYLIFRLKKMFFKLIRAMYKKTRKDNKEKRWKHIRKKKTKKGM